MSQLRQEEALESMSHAREKSSLRFNDLKNERLKIESEMQELNVEITTKDNIIKTLTKENLQINSNCTQL